LNAPHPLLLIEQLELQRAADQLFANRFLPVPHRAVTSLRTCSDLFDWAVSRIQARPPKRIDFSGRARSVAWPALYLDVAAIPSFHMIGLDLPDGGPVLLTRDPLEEEYSTPIVVLHARRHESPVIAMHPSHAEAIFSGVAGVAECVVHRPLSLAAIFEAEMAVGRVLRAPSPPPKSWMDGDPRSVAMHLIDAAAEARALEFEGPLGIIAGGPGIERFIEIMPALIRNDPVAEVRLPPDATA
jgi:hypothetical protein